SFPSMPQLRARAFALPPVARPDPVKRSTPPTASVPRPPAPLLSYTSPTPETMIDAELVTKRRPPPSSATHGAMRARDVSPLCDAPNRGLTPPLASASVRLKTPSLLANVWCTAIHVAVHPQRSPACESSSRHPCPPSATSWRPTWRRRG